MRQAELYQHHAFECIERAVRADDEMERTRFLQMAQRWRDLARDEKAALPEAPLDPADPAEESPDSD